LEAKDSAQAISANQDNPACQCRFINIKFPVKMMNGFVQLERRTIPFKIYSAAMQS
jgi:hypothetical protein